MLYRELINLYEELSKTTKRLEKTYLIANFVKKVSQEDFNNLDKVIMLIQGKVFPDYDQRKTGVAEKIVIKAISKATGNSEKTIIEKFKEVGDLGDVSFLLLNKKKQHSLFPRNLSIKEVYENIKTLSEQEGKGSIENKITIISDLLINAEPIEAKYIIRTLVDNLRLGFGKSTIRDSLIWAFFSEKLNLNYNIEENALETNLQYRELIDKIQFAYDILNDYGEISLMLAKNHNLDNIQILPGKPINLMLFYKANNINEAFSSLGKPLAFEYKYDGFRLQIHNNNQEIKLFTRNLENVSEQFPEIISFIKDNIKAEKIILDCEAVAYDKKTFKSIPFQLISQRIKRKYNINEMAEKYPVEIKVFDILLYENKTLLNENFEQRRQLLEKIIPNLKYKISLAEQIITDNENEAESFYKKALSLGFEGIMAKNLKSTYKPGRKIGTGVKIKPIMEPLDLVIIAAEYGEGKRSGFLSTFYIACIDENNQFREIGKVSTGLKELENQGFSFKELTKLLEPLIIKKQGTYVKIKPEIVIEVAYEEIQKSPTYDSGYALRFPRFLRLREDKSVKDISDIKLIEQLYQTQKGKELKKQ